MGLQRRASGELLMTASGALADECCCIGAECSWQLSPGSLSFDCQAQNGGFTVNIPSGAGCGWSASVTSGGAYLSINSGGSGSLAGLVGITLTANDGVDRTGQITVVTTVISPLGPIGSLIGVFNVAQDECAGEGVGGGRAGGPLPPGQECTWSLSPMAATYDCFTQSGSFNVNTNTGCDWAASVISGGSFITINSGSTGTDSGTLIFTISANGGAPRGGQIEVMTTVVSILGPIGTVIGVYNVGQSQCGSGSGGGGSPGAGGSPCEWTFSPKEVTAGECSIQPDETIDVTAPAGCSWNAVVIGDPFVAITSGSSGLSSGTIHYSVQSNTTGAYRATQIRITSGSGSAFGAPGTLIGYVNIYQDTCADCAGVPPLATSYTVSGGPITQNDTGGGFINSVAPPIWDGVLPHCPPFPATSCNWQAGGGGACGPGHVSWLGKALQPDGFSHENKYITLIIAVGWRLQIGTSTYTKTTGATPAGIYTRDFSSLPVTLTVS